MLIFGEQQIPVGVASAVTDSKEIKFNDLHECGNPVGIKKPSEKVGQTAPAKTITLVSATKKTTFCQTCNVEVETVVKGFEYAKGLFLSFNDADLAIIKPAEQKTIALNKFVPTTVTPLMVKDSYILIPSPNVPISYGQLYATLAETKLIGIGTQNLWGKEHPCAVCVEQSYTGHSVLMMHTLHLHEDRAVPDFSAPIPDAAAKKAMKEVVTGLKGVLETEDLVSTQRARFNTLLQKKLYQLQQPEEKPELVDALKPKVKKKVKV